ncbi:alpha/beta hydrolase [Aquimarina algiphila]|uniref:Lysophospholipase n=1 Tax=Aquimarina algiphila TaxID=2047982 RepID=A0A554VHD1_9FLAO|nr:alpha/beta fold hydrolase [Aquimarina algiphila]TSE06889.1 lysophospholipase [Aquimarina algiphila]
MQKLRNIFLYGVCFYGVVLLLLYCFQEKILFQPEELSNNYTFQFEDPFNEFFLKTNDGNQLNAIHFTTKKPKGVILYFHGNKGSLKRWGNIASFFVKKKYDVVVMDYREYGKSTGKISEQVLYKDAQLFYDYVKNIYPENQIVVYGRSLGTGIAAKVASENNPNHLVLETPYYNIKDVAEHWFPYFPVSFILKYNLPSDVFVKKVSCDITIYHGTEDKVVPYQSGERLFKSISISNKRMITIKGGEHNNLIEFNTYRSTIDEILKND